MVKIIRCLRCHRRYEIPAEIIKVEKCKYCKETRFLSMYENTSVSVKKSLQSMKGGHTLEMAAKKEKPAKEAKVKEPSITEKRIENAKAVLELLKSLGVEGKETTAVLSRAYNTFKGK